jgi:hypothetical protein
MSRRDPPPIEKEQNPMSTRRLIVISAVALAAAAGLALAGCTAAKPDTTPTPARTATAAAAPKLPAMPATPPTNPAQPETALCGASDLQFRVGNAMTQGDVTDLPLIVTNTSSTTCVLDGYPSVQFVSDAAGTRIGPEATRDRSVPVIRYPLAPGVSAGSQVYISSAAASCSSPATAVGFRVVMPGSSPVFVPTPTTYPACPDAELLSVTPTAGQ